MGGAALFLFFTFSTSPVASCRGSYGTLNFQNRSTWRALISLTSSEITESIGGGGGGGGGTCPIGTQHWWDHNFHIGNQQLCRPLKLHGDNLKLRRKQGTPPLTIPASKGLDMISVSHIYSLANFRTWGGAGGTLPSASFWPPACRAGGARGASCAASCKWQEIYQHQGLFGNICIDRKSFPNPAAEVPDATNAPLIH